MVPPIPQFTLPQVSTEPSIGVVTTPPVDVPSGVVIPTVAVHLLVPLIQVESHNHIIATFQFRRTATTHLTGTL